MEKQNLEAEYDRLQPKVPSTLGAPSSAREEVGFVFPFPSHGVFFVRCCTAVQASRTMRDRQRMSEIEQRLRDVAKETTLLRTQIRSTAPSVV